MNKFLKWLTAAALSLSILSGVVVTPQSIATSQNVAYAKSYSIHVVSSHLSLHRGNVAYVTIKGKPHARGTIRVVYKSGPSTARGLQSKVSSKGGVVTWSWLVGGNTTKKNYTIYVSLGGKTKPLTLHVY